MFLFLFLSFEVIFGLPVGPLPGVLTSQLPVAPIPPLVAFQGALQASVPIPLTIHYDVPRNMDFNDGATSSSSMIPFSFMQLKADETLYGDSFALRILPTEETPEILSDELKALKSEEDSKSEYSRKTSQTRERVLLEAIHRGVGAIVEDIMAPLRALPNPFS